MNTIRILIAGLLMALAGSAQTPITMYVSNAQMAAPTTVTQAGTAGTTTYYYWIVANYTGGNAQPAGPLITTGSNATLSSANYNVVAFSAPTSPVSTPTQYDVLRTTSATPPSGACACAVATAQSGSPVNDQSNSLSAYTVNTVAAMSSAVYGDMVTTASSIIATQTINGVVSWALKNTGTVVNHLQVDNSATGTAVAIEPIGTDSTIKLNIKSKGAVAVQMNGIDAFNSSGVYIGTAGTAQIGATPFTAFSTPIPAVVGNITSITDVSGKIWYSQVYIPTNVTLTGICVQSGSATTDSFTMGIYNAAGTLLRSSALAGATLATASSPNCQNLTSTLAVTGPSSYFLAIQGNGTTAASFFVYGAAGVTGFITGSQAGTFGTLAAISSPATSFTASVGPVMYVW